MRFLFLIVIVSITNFSYSQSTIDSRLTDIYSTEYIQSLNQNRINVLEYELDHSYFIIDNYEKNESLPNLYKINIQTKEVIEESLTIDDLNNFNVLNYAYEKKYDNRTYYKLGNTDKTIVFYSIKEFTQNYNLTK